MIKIKELTVRNFMSVGNQTQAVNFGREQLTLVLGENLDQGGSFIGSYTAGAEASPSLSSADRILAVAHLCEEYCRDPEGAISILTAGHRWMQALRLAFRYNRDDLSSEVLLVLSCLSA